MSLTRTAAVAVIAAALPFLAGCGGSQVAPASGSGGSAVEPTPTTAAATPTTAHTTRPGATRPAAPAASKTPTAGNGDAAESTAPSTAGGGVCSHLGAGAVSKILGVTVRGAAVPGQTGCTFEQGGNRGMSVTVLDKSAAQAHGMDGAKSEANSAVEGQPQDVPGIGSAAFVITGSMFGGPDVNAAGAVQVGARIISVYLVQHSGLAEARVRGMEVDLLKLVAGAHG